MCPESGGREILLQPGEFVLAGERDTIRTLLGSCVAVTFWHPARRIGAMCHYILARRFTPKDAPPDPKYAEDVIPAIRDRFRQRGLSPVEFEVRMFGGSNMFPDLCLDECLNIGARNASEGKRILEACGFRIASRDLAGSAQRMVLFTLGSGRVDVRQGGNPLEPAAEAGAVRREVP